MPRPYPLWTIFTVFALIGSIGCAAQREPLAPETPEAPMAPPAPASTAAPTDEPANIDSLEADLAREEASLQSLVGLAKSAPAEEAGPEAAPPATPPRPAATGAARADSLELESSERSCDRACRALGSMRRSAEGICRLSGDDTDRCQRAQDRVDAAGQLVRGAGCSC